MTTNVWCGVTDSLRREATRFDAKKRKSINVKKDWPYRDETKRKLTSKLRSVRFGCILTGRSVVHGLASLCMLTVVTGVSAIFKGVN